MAAQAQAAKSRKRRILPEHYDRVSTMLIAMVPYPMIEKQLSMEWTKPKSYVQSVVKQVHEDWAHSASLVSDTRRHQIRHSFETLYMKAASAKDLNAQTRILRELALLDGAYAKTQVEIAHSGGIGVGIALGTLGFKNPEEVRGRIEYLRDQLAAGGPKVLNQGYGTAAGINQTLGLPLPSSTAPDPQDDDQEQEPGGDP